ncbi:MAG: metalloregulator ArsR/SmtB family transcription factor [Calditrichia bacterium]
MNLNNAATCSETVVNYPLVQKVSKELPSEEAVQDMAATFKALSDPTRLQIVLALSRAELCVCDLTALTNVSASAISHQLRVLRNLRLVKYRKEGKMVYYSLDDQHINHLLSEALEHVNE